MVDSLTDNRLFQSVLTDDLSYGYLFISPCLGIIYILTTLSIVLLGKQVYEGLLETCDMMVLSSFLFLHCCVKKHLKKNKSKV